MIYSKPLCEDCIFRNFDEPGAYCKAYPKGIPNRYLMGGQKHDKVQKDQTGKYVLTTK